jgi:predicted lipoprotein with Yx(FWY)xxD motif
MRTARITILALTIVAAGCGGSDAAGVAAPSDRMTATSMTADGAAAKTTGRTVKVVRSQFGSILGDGRGQAFYLFDKEKTRKSECYRACARAWPPVLTKGRPKAGKGARKSLIGTTRRRDGSLQVTYRGRPLYYYVHDAPGRVLCHNVDEFGGLWLVLRASGKAVS